MYDINDQWVTLLALSLRGTLRDVNCPASDTREVINRAIVCDSAALISLPQNVQVWVNALGRRSDAEPNLYSAAVFATLDMDRIGAVALGTVVLASARGDATVSLDSRTREFVTGLVVSLGGRTFRSVPMDGGRAWEWEYAGTRFRAESRNGSPVVVLQFRTNVLDSVWTVSTERQTHGRSAKSVVMEMFRETTGGER